MDNKDKTEKAVNQLSNDILFILLKYKLFGEHEVIDNHCLDCVEEIHDLLYRFLIAHDNDQQKGGPGKVLNLTGETNGND